MSLELGLLSVVFILPSPPTSEFWSLRHYFPGHVPHFPSPPPPFKFRITTSHFSGTLVPGNAALLTSPLSVSL